MISSFSAIVGDNPRILILGSMPGEDSLRKQQYYGHPRNAFWPIFASLLHFQSETSYEERLSILKKNHIALWDVIKCCQRQGSLDSAILKESIEPNDFAALLNQHRSITHIYFNGNTAFTLFRSKVWPKLTQNPIKKSAKPTTVTLCYPEGIPRTLTPLPSTSPAHATRTLEQKQTTWHEAIQPIL